MAAIHWRRLKQRHHLTAFTLAPQIQRLLITLIQGEEFLEKSLVMKYSVEPSSLRSNSFALIVPTLNEAGNIGPLLDSVQQALNSADNPYTVIVVDDGSTDGTREIVRDYSRRDARIQLAPRDGQSGLAGAILHGWAQSDAELLGVMDADLQHPPDLLPSMLAAADDDVDIVVASRYAKENGVRGWNPVRALISRLSTLATRPLLSNKLGVTDPMSGFFIVRRECIDGLTFQSKGFKLLLEILVRGKIRKAREVPYRFGLRRAGRSKASASVAVQYVFLLGRLSWDTVVRSGPR
jgi:dolichol-phosphate mannosyltransferase